MCAYAEAYCSSVLDNDTGVFTTSHGDIEIVRDGLSLKGRELLQKLHILVALMLC